MGGSPRFRTGTHVGGSFKIEAAGAGAVDTVPAYGPVIKIAGFSETITPTTGPVAYDPTSLDGDSAALYFNHDGILHKSLGVRAEMGFDYQVGEIPYFNFNWTGLYVAPTDTAAETPVYTAFQAPLAGEDGNTPTFSIDGYDAIMERFTISAGQSVKYRNLVNQERVRITERDYTGSATIKGVSLATKDFFALAKAETLVALSFQHGVVAGAKVIITAAKTQILDVQERNNEGDLMYELSLAFTATDNGDDDLQISTQ